MSVRRLADTQPDAFAFTAENAAWARGQIAKYPQGRQASAVIPLLWQAQKQHDGWLPEPAIAHVAEMLGMAKIRVLEIATFYTMFNLAPVGRHHVQLCGTTPCMLRGAEDLKAVCRRVIGEVGDVTPDGALSWVEVECLGACCNAPMVQINDDYYEDLTAQSFEQLLADLRAGRPVTIGSQAGRVSSEPAGGVTTLTEAGLFEIWKTRAKPGLDVAPAPAPAAAEIEPETPAARGQNAGRPDKADTPEAEAARAPAGGAPAKAPDPRARTEPADRVGSPATPAETAPVLHAGSPAEGADDLKVISGIGPKLEGLLHDLGVWRFDQIAGWTPENVAWVDARLKFKGRIVRERWIEQARALIAGGGA